MLPAIRLFGFGLRQVIGVVPDVTGTIIQLVEKHFTDHSQTLPKALAKANDRAWQAVGIALAEQYVEMFLTPSTTTYCCPSREVGIFHDAPRTVVLR